jgi:hypothetical protein
LSILWDFPLPGLYLAASLQKAEEGGSAGPVPQTLGYSRLKEDVTLRKKVAEQVEIGFELPTEKTEVHPK